MSSRAEARARKKHRNAIKAGLPDLAPTETGRKARGGTRQREIETDMKRPNLEARARRMGKPIKEAKAMDDDTLSEGAGMALRVSLHHDTAKRLLAHYTALTAAEWRYHKTLGMSIYPKTAKIEMMPERFEVSASDNIDLRTEEERDRAAKNAWAIWDGHLTSIGLAHSSAIDTAKHGFADLVADGKATPAGRRFVAAMVALDALLT